MVRILRGPLGRLGI